LIQDTIFEEPIKKIKLSNSISSFADCPNKCIEGYYVDPYAHKRVKCTYCENKRKQLANNAVQLDGSNDIKRILNLPNSFVGYGNFEMSTIIPESQQKLMTEDSVNNMSSILSDLLNKASIGVASDESLLINLGLNAYPSNFIYSYLMRAYISGMLVSPYLTARDVFLMLKYETDSIDEEVLDLGENVSVKYKDLLNTDICVIHITTGANYSHVRAVKGLMQMRAHNNKSTLIFTDAWWFNSSSTTEKYLKASLQSLYSDDIQSKAVARLVKISYNINDNKGTSQSEEVPKGVKNRGSFGEMSQNQLNDLLSSKTRL
jgi:hypothetical protein